MAAIAVDSIAQSIQLAVAPVFLLTGIGSMLNVLATPDPKLWKIVDGKLYLNCSAAAEEKWLADVPGNIAKGNAFWATQQ